MNTNDYVFEIKERTLGNALLERVYGLYLDERNENGMAEIAEQEYEESKKVLTGILTGEQAATIHKAEELCLKSAKWLAEFAFTRGHYVGFEHHFVPASPARQFESAVVKWVMRMPTMQKYPDYFTRREQARKLFENAQSGLEQNDAEHIARIEATWQSRFYGILRHAYYLGYRCAIATVQKIAPLGYDSDLTDKILAAEHELGFTATKGEREMRAAVQDTK